MNLIKALGKKVAEKRKLKNLSQEKLADLANIHRTYVSQIERGLKAPTIPVLVEIAKALETTASQIIKEVENEI